MMKDAAGIDIGPVLDFLGTRSPAVWAQQAAGALGTLLADHASLELKAAQQAQQLIRKYGAGSGGGRQPLTAAFRSRLIHRMSRLAREELRHFEQVVALIERRGGRFVAISPSRYAGALHALAARSEPDALIDQLCIGAIIEARSCERFAALLGPLGIADPELAAFYRSLLRSEARHFENYLSLAREIGGADLELRLARFLDRDAELVTEPDSELRFHSGPLAAVTAGVNGSSRSPRPSRARP